MLTRHMLKPLLLILLAIPIPALAVPIEPAGYRYVEEPGVLAVKPPVKGFLKKDNDQAILIDGASAGNVRVDKWGPFYSDITTVRILFDLGSDVDLSYILLAQAWRHTNNHKPALVRILGMTGGNSSNELSLLKSIFWDQARDANAKIELNGAVARYIEIELYPAKKSRYQISEVSFDGKRLNSGKEARKVLADRPWVDCFGQYRRESWPKKIYSKKTLVAQGERDLLSAKEIPELSYPHDKYGGLADSGKKINLESTGYFRVENVNGKWWFVTPEGNLFFAVGLDGVANVGMAAFREEYSDAYETCPQVWVNFSSKNLNTKYGNNWRDKWTRMSLYRMRRWNFNTIGKWSSKFLWDAGRATAPYPYTSVLKINDFVTMVPRIGGGGSVPDVFDQGFESGVRQAFEIKTMEFKDDPWFLGYMLNNEQVWNWKLVKDIMALDADKWAIKKKLTTWLKERYGENIQLLAKQWKLPVSSYDEILKQIVIEKPAHKARKEMELFVGVVAEKYFSTVARELRRADPNHLYLGNSMAWLWCEDAVKAYGRHVDVASFDRYTREFDKPFFDMISTIVNRPILIAEYGLTRAGRGLRPFRFTLAHKEERAGLYQQYTKDIAARPYMVGSFYFLYKDLQISGKKGYFAKNSALGFVDVTDQVNEVLAGAATDINSQIYDIRKP